MFSRFPITYKERMLKVLLRLTLIISLLSTPATVFSATVSSPAYTTGFVVKGGTVITALDFIYNTKATIHRSGKWDYELSNTRSYARQHFNCVIKTKHIRLIADFNNIKPILGQILFFPPTSAARTSTRRSYKITGYWAS